MADYTLDDRFYKQKYGYKNPSSHPLAPIIVFWIISLACVAFYLYLYITYVFTDLLEPVFIIPASTLVALELLIFVLLLVRHSVCKQYKALISLKSNKYGFKDVQIFLERTKKEKFFNERIETNCKHCNRRFLNPGNESYYLYILNHWPFSDCFYTVTIIESINRKFAKLEKEFFALKSALEKTNNNFLRQNTYKKSLFSVLSEIKRNVNKTRKNCSRFLEISKEISGVLESYNQQNLDLVKYDQYDEKLIPFCKNFEDIKKRYDDAITNNYEQELDILKELCANEKIEEISALLNKICFVEGGEKYIDELDLVEKGIELKTINDVLREFEPNEEIVTISDNQIEKATSIALNIDAYYYSFFTKYIDDLGQLLDEQLELITSLQETIAKEKAGIKDNLIELSVAARVNCVNDLDTFVKENYDYAGIKKMAEDILNKKRKIDGLLCDDFEKLLKTIINDKEYEVLDLFVKENQQRVLKYHDENNNNFLHLLIPDDLDYLFAISSDDTFTSFFFESNYDGIVPLDYLDSIWLERIVNLDKSSLDLNRLKIQSAPTQKDNIAFSEKYLAYIYENSSYGKRAVIKSVDLNKTTKYEYESIAKYMHKAAYKRFDVEKVLKDLSPYRNYLPFHFSTLFAIYEKMIDNINKGDFTEAAKRMYLIKRCSGLFISTTLKKMVKDVSVTAKENVVYEPNEIINLLKDIYYVSNSSVNDTLCDEITELRNTVLNIAKRMYEKDPKEELFDSINALDKDFQKENSWYDEYLSILGLTKPVTIDDIRHAYNMKRIELRNSGASMDKITELNEVYNRLLRQ